jgi:hypothetical protein
VNLREKVTKMKILWENLKKFMGLYRQMKKDEDVKRSEAKKILIDALERVASMRKDLP